MPSITPYLEDLESRINPAAEAALWSEWEAFVNGKYKGGGVFSPRRPAPSPSKIEWPVIKTHQAIHDYDLMAIQQLKECSGSLEKGSGLLMNIRSNYGTSTIPSLFGVELFNMDGEFDILPTSRPLSGGTAAVRKIIDAGVPSRFDVSLAGRALETAARFKEMIKPYPNISRFIYNYHPDLQGPLDVCEVIWGGELFTVMIDDPDLVESFLDLLTDTYIALMKEWNKVFPFETDCTAHWGLMIKGHIMLRNDSEMNFSGRMYEKRFRKYDQKLLDVFGGGAVHACGKLDHYLDSVTSMHGLTGIQMSQPEYNDMSKVLALTIERGIPLLGLPPKTARELIDAGVDLRGRVHSDLGDGFGAGSLKDAPKPK
jgi:hypothetical protein